MLGLTPALQSQVALAMGVTGTANASVPAKPAITSRASIWASTFGGRQLVHNVPMKSVSYDASGYFTMELEDGSIWRQVHGDRAKLNRDNIHFSQDVTIKEGPLASKTLSVRGDASVYKVILVSNN